MTGAPIKESRVPDERRKHSRKFSSPGRIDLDDGWACFCLVHDLSDGGARLTSVGPEDLPETFKLSLPSGVSPKCRVVWRSKQAIGVKFFEPESEVASPQN